MWVVDDADTIYVLRRRTKTAFGRNLDQRSCRQTQGRWAQKMLV